MEEVVDSTPISTLTFDPPLVRPVNIAIYPGTRHMVVVFSADENGAMERGNGKKYMLDGDVYRLDTGDT